MDENQIINKLIEIIRSQQSKWSKVGNGIELKNSDKKTLLVRDTSRTISVNKVVNL